MQQITNASVTAYDDAYRTMLEKCSSLILPVLSEFFGEAFTGNETVTLNQNELFISTPDGSSYERITDSSFQVIGDTVKKRYNLECQSTKDQTIMLRLFEYDSQIALDHSVLKDDRLVVEFPQSALIYLRSNEHTPDEMILEIRTPEGQSVSYCVPVMKLQSYELQELFDKKLWFLLPFHSFCYESRLKESESNEEKRRELSDIFREMRTRMDDLCSCGQMNEYQKYRIIFCARMVAEKLMEKYPNVRKEVLDVMGGKVVECEADWILQRGIQQGMQQMIEKMLHKHRTPEEIADFCDCDLREVEAVQEKMQKGSR